MYLGKKEVELSLTRDLFCSPKSWNQRLNLQEDG